MCCGYRHAVRTKYARNSLLPSPPAMGEGISPCRVKPQAAALAVTRSTAARRSRSAVTTPCRDRAAVPHSNCGLTRLIRNPPGSSIPASAGRISVWEMKDTSITAPPTFPANGLPSGFLPDGSSAPSVSGVSRRALTPSAQRTRSSARSRGCSCPCPASMQYTLAAGNR